MDLNAIDINTPQGRKTLRAAANGKLPTVVALIDRIEFLEGRMQHAKNAWDCWIDWVNGKFDEGALEQVRSYDGYNEIVAYFSSLQ